MGGPDHDDHDDQEYGDHDNDDNDRHDQVAQRTAAKLAPRFESPDEMSDEEEILFDDIYEVASHCQHSYFILTINSFIVVIVSIIIFGKTNKVNLISTPNIVIINQSIYDT